MARLNVDSTKGLPTTFNTYGNPATLSFGWLKAPQGFSSVHVFHSLRNTLIPLDPGVSEYLAADMVRPEKPRITSDLYSGVTLPAIKAPARELVKYPL